MLGAKGLSALFAEVAPPPPPEPGKEPLEPITLPKNGLDGHPIEVLTLRQCALMEDGGDAGVKAMAKSMPKLKGLRRLNLYGNA